MSLQSRVDAIGTDATTQRPDPMTRIALNGLGRIGKLVLRDLIDTGAGGEIVLLNDPVGDAEQHALLMEFDSVHGRWRTPVAHEDGALVLNGQHHPPDA